MDRNSVWMAVSGATGFIFFLVANFTVLFHGSAVLAGIVQVCINAFVFSVWLKAFQESTGVKKFVALFGVVVPVVMASITMWYVLLPAVL